MIILNDDKMKRKTITFTDKNYSWIQELRAKAIMNNEKNTSFTFFVNDRIQRMRNINDRVWQEVDELPEEEVKE